MRRKISRLINNIDKVFADLESIKEKESFELISQTVKQYYYSLISDSDRPQEIRNACLDYLTVKYRKLIKETPENE